MTRAYRPPVCDDCGHLIQRDERTVCRCCGTEIPSPATPAAILATVRPVVLPVPDTGDWLTLAEAVALCDQIAADVVALVREHAIPVQRLDGERRIHQQSFVAVLQRKGLPNA